MGGLASMAFSASTGLATGSMGKASGTMGAGKEMVSSMGMVGLAALPLANMPSDLRTGRQPGQRGLGPRCAADDR